MEICSFRSFIALLLAQFLFDPQFDFQLGENIVMWFFGSLQSTKHSWTVSVQVQNGLKFNSRPSTIIEILHSV